MALTLMSGPAEEPVTVAEAKAHLRIDGSDEDVLIASLILTSRLHVEAAMGLALITQDWKLTLDRWPESGEVRFPVRPLQSIASATVADANGTPVTISATDYTLDGQALTPRLIGRNGAWPQPEMKANGIEIRFTAGIGDEAADIPQPIRQAILLLVAHWYEHRDPLEIGSPATAIPLPISELLKPYREVRL